MIKFKPIPDVSDALKLSPMMNASEKLFSYIEKHDGIGLTPSKAFKRVFVEWAAGEFNWPGYSKDELFKFNKVLNEIDFPPLMDLHDLLISLKIGRHYKGKFKLSKTGKELFKQPGRLFGVMISFYLFEVDHHRFSRRSDSLMGNWDIFLNVIGDLTTTGATGGQIRRALYGEHEGTYFDYTMTNLYIHVLRPLCWTGLLLEKGGEKLRRNETSLFVKTLLWDEALEL